MPISPKQVPLLLGFMNEEGRLPLRSFYSLMSNSVAPRQCAVSNDTEDNTVSASEKEVGHHGNSKIANATNEDSFRQHFVGRTYK